MTGRTASAATPTPAADPAPVVGTGPAPAATRRPGSPPDVVLGYLVPEFPGQTHAFFWREVAALTRAGVRPLLVSTRRPRGTAAAHAWAGRAAARTRYLTDWSPGAVAVLVRAVRAGRVRAVVREVRAAAADVGVLRASGLALAGARLAALARQGRWQHLHVHSCAGAAQVAVLAHALAGVPYSLQLHGPLADYGGNQRAKWRHASFALVITEDLRREVRAALAGDLPPVVAVAPMGVDPDRFARTTPYVPHPPDEPGSGPLRVVSCGRLNPSKGHDDLVRAVRLLVDAGRDVELTVAGEDEHGGTGYRRDLEALVTASRLEHRVHLLGSVGEDEVLAVLERAHVFALASHAEPLGVAIMEAMALELPVVVADGGGVRALVRDGTGLLVPPRDPAALAAALARVADDPGLASGLGRRAREHVVEGFGSDRSARTLARLLTEAPTGPPAGSVTGPRADVGGRP